MFHDWTAARGRAWAEAVAKFSYWQQLPWKICQLAHHNWEVRVQGARQCLELWELGGPGTRHPQAKRFLSPDWDGDETDPGLLHLVRRVAQGESLKHPEFNPLTRWLSRLNCIRVAERSVEGIHASISRVIKNARGASIPFISVELRFEQFWSTIAADPRVTSQ